MPGLFTVNVMCHFQHHTPHRQEEIVIFGGLFVRVLSVSVTDWSYSVSAFQIPELFDPVSYIQKCQESDGSSTVLSATEIESPDPE